MPGGSRCYLKICLHKVKHKTNVGFVAKHIKKLRERKGQNRQVTAKHSSNSYALTGQITDKELTEIAQIIKYFVNSTHCSPIDSH